MSVALAAALAAAHAGHAGRAAHAAELYWDANGATPGGSNVATANGTWGASNFWSTSPTGSTTTTAWVAARTAVFSAGTNVTGSSNVSVSGTQNASGITFEEGTVTLGGSGTIALSGVEPAITVGASAAARVAVINASINAAGATGVVRIVRGTSGAATLTLAGGSASAFAGGLRVDGGGMRVNTNSSGALGGATGGAVTVTGSDTVFSSSLDSAITLADIAIANDFVLNPAGGAGGFVTAFAAAGNTLGTTRVTYGGDISGDADVLISAAPPAPAPDSTEASGFGLTVFGGTNTYAGRTIVNVGANGTFQLGSAGALPPGRALVFGRGQADGSTIGAMDLAGQDVTIASLATDASGVPTQRGITNSSAAQGGTITVTGSAHTTFTGVIGVITTPSMINWGFSGSNNLTVTLAGGHTGSLTLTGASTYSGATTINGGTLVVAHTATDAPTVAGNVIVNSGGRLASASAGGASVTAAAAAKPGASAAGGISTSASATTATTATTAAPATHIGGAVTLNDGGVLEPGGAGAAILHIAGGLAINSDSPTTGGTLRFTLDGATSHDQIDLGAATLTLDDGFHPVEISATAAAAPAAGTYTLMNYGARAFDGVHGVTKTLDPGGPFSYTLDFTDTALRLIVAPLTQTFSWDVGGGGAPIVEGAGTWADGGTNFSDLAANAGATYANAGSADVIIGNDPAAAGGTITLAGPVRTGGRLTFGPIDPSTPYTIDGGGGGGGGGGGDASSGHTLTTVGGISANASATINARVVLESSQSWHVAAGRTLAVTRRVSGAASTVLTKSGDGVLALGGTNEVGGLHVAAGVLRLTTGLGATKADQLTIAAGARVDLRDNKLITNGPVGAFDGAAYTGVQGEVARAYNFGAWDQPGLTTSEQRAGQNAGPLSNTTTIGVATAEQVLFIGPTDTAIFAGHTVTGASVIAMYTYAGDLNFDGLVDGADYGVIDNSAQFPGTDGYANGDFNYDGVIDGADYGIIDNTIQLQGDPIPGVVFGTTAASARAAAVPEPLHAGWLMVSAIALRMRRHRREPPARARARPRAR